MVTDDELKPEYRREELGEGIQGKYFKRYKQGTNLVLLDLDVATVFPTAKSVNDALRSFIHVAERAVNHARQLDS